MKLNTLKPKLIIRKQMEFGKRSQSFMQAFYQKQHKMPDLFEYIDKINAGKFPHQHKI